ncbi:MAG TPA: hypothetical protein VNH11_13075 [Pirellulales bacterium]|nr:hypothetical protein [Pirellulales bacterium]
MALAVCLAPFTSLLTRGDAILSDPKRDYNVMHLPLARFAREELLAGRCPLWNPYLACGQPLQAAQQALLFYPLSTPLVMVFGADRGLLISLFAHLALCYAGTYLVARRADLSRCAAAYAGLVATWGGALTGHLVEGHFGAVLETALVPWFYLTLVDLLRSPDVIRSARFATVAALGVLAAQPQVLYYAVVAGAFWAAGSLCCGDAARHRAPAVRWGIVAAVVAALIAGVQLVPLAELMRDGLSDSPRGTAPFAAKFALDGIDSARLLVPFVNGTPFAHVAQFDGADMYHERVVYLGFAVPLLAIVGLSRARRPGWQWGAAWSLVAALGLAFGDSTPALGLLGRALPGLFLFRCPGRVFLVASLPAALLAARGLDGLARGEPRAGRMGLLHLAAVTLASASIPVYAALALAPSFDWQRYAQYARENLLEDLSLWTVLALNATAIIGLGATRRLGGLAVSLPLIAIAASDLGYFNLRNFRMEDREPRSASELPPTDSMTRFVEASAFGHIDYDALRYSGLTRAAISEHRRAVGTYDGGVLPAATARLFKSIETRSGPPLTLATCALAWSASGHMAQNPGGVLPRIRFVCGACAAAELPIEEMTDGDTRDLSSQSGAAVLDRETPRELRMDVSAPVDGWLVVADTYYPGWICEVDGVSQPIDAAHGVFRRVRLEAGRHTVVMRYEPLSFFVGLIATMTGVLIVAAMLLGRWGTRRRGVDRTIRQMVNATP